MKRIIYMKIITVVMFIFCCNCMFAMDLPFTWGDGHDGTPGIFPLYTDNDRFLVTNINTTTNVITASTSSPWNFDPVGLHQDYVLVIQMEPDGAALAGKCQIARVVDPTYSTPGFISVDPACNITGFSWTGTGIVQVINIPQYYDLICVQEIL